jgi:hypothetical protein
MPRSRPFPFPAQNCNIYHIKLSTCDAQKDVSGDTQRAYETRCVLG